MILNSENNCFVVAMKLKGCYPTFEYIYFLWLFIADVFTVI